MTDPWYRRLGEGLSKTRGELRGHLNVLLRKGPDLDQAFWEDLEDALLQADMGALATSEMVDRLRDLAAREALPDAEAVIDRIQSEIAAEVASDRPDPFGAPPVTVLVVGVNGTGKTTSVGKLAKSLSEAGNRVVIGSGDTFRAAAIEQLRVWAERADVPVVERPHGSDPAAVVFDTLEAAKQRGADTVLIDTAGRLHTSADLMLELAKVKRIAERESPFPVRVVLVMDATTGQNGLVQAREFDRALGLDGIVLTKLDGTARGGIVVAVARELGVPIVRIGVGEGADDLEPFDPGAFAQAIVGRKP
ncbi:MAG: signal recognition particle-docking protein FtsY [Actinobacteria bacterium]|nr:signal recognition particle-docking protein FtsY [Actinomycetota bacterium]